VLVALAGVAVGGIALGRAGSTASFSLAPASPDYREALVASQRPLTLDPLLAGADTASSDVSHLLYRALLRLDDRAQPVPDLAATWSVSGDGLTYRFVLAANTSWSDGKPLTPQDVIATIGAVQAPDFPDARLAAEWQGVHLAADGADAVVTKLPAPRAAFATAAARLRIVPRAVAETSLAQLTLSRASPLPTSGAYRVRSTDAQSVLLEPNPTSTRHAGPRLVQLRLEPDFQSAAQALAAGQVDALGATTPSERAALAGLTGVTLHDTVTFRFVDLLLNARQPGLADVAVRKAIASAVDRRSLIATALGGAARPQVDAEPVGISWLGPGSTEDPQPTLAARALDAAGWTMVAPDGVRQRAGATLRFSLSVPDVAPLPEVAHAVSRQLGAMGIAIDVTPVPAASFDASVLSPAKFDMAIVDWDSGPDPDISSFWRSNATPPHGENVSGTAVDLFLDRALDDLATESDPQLRQAAALRVEQRLADEVPAVFLYAPVTSLATRATISHVAVPQVGTAQSRWDLIDQWRSGSG
jgi:peptide/nickel transport system substrate-binding protein